MLADSMRFDPPKIRELIDWMDEKKIDNLADADRDELIEKAREIGFSVYADTAKAIKRSRFARIQRDLVQKLG